MDDDALLPLSNPLMNGTGAAVRTPEPVRLSTGARRKSRVSLNNVPSSPVVVADSASSEVLVLAEVAAPSPSVPLPALSPMRRSTSKPFKGADTLPLIGSPTRSPSIGRRRDAGAAPAVTASVATAAETTNDLFALFCAKQMMFHSKGVKAIFLEYTFTLEASQRTRFQGKVTRYRNELEHEVRRIGLAQRQQERQQERQERQEEERKEKAKREAEEADRREKSRKAAALKKRKATAAKKKKENEDLKAAEAVERAKAEQKMAREAEIKIKMEQKARRTSQKIVRWREERAEPEVFERVLDVIVEPPIALLVDWHHYVLPSTRVAVVVHCVRAATALPLPEADDASSHSHTLTTTPTLHEGANSASDSSALFSPDSNSTSATVVPRVDLFDLSSSSEGELADAAPPMSTMDLLRFGSFARAQSPLNESASLDEAEEDMDEDGVLRSGAGDCESRVAVTVAPAWVTVRGDVETPAVSASAGHTAGVMLWPFLRKARLDLGKKFGKDRTNEQQQLAK